MIFILLWIISPLALIPLVIVFGVQKGKLNKKVTELEHRILYMKYENNVADKEKPQNIAQNLSEDNLQENIVDSAVDTNIPDAAAIDVSAPIETSKPMSASSENVKSSPYDMSYTGKLPMPKNRPLITKSIFKDEESKIVYNAADLGDVISQPNENTSMGAEFKAAQSLSYPVKEKKKISTINIVLIIGAAFIILAELIFASTSWDFLPGFARAIIILSLSAILFAFSSIAERKLDLKKTGKMFYTIGSFSVPITMLAVGYFELFGKWFSLSGDGKYLLISTIFAITAFVCFKGSSDYDDKKFAWCSLFSLSAAVFMLTLSITDKMEYASLMLAAYSFAFVFLAEKFALFETRRFRVIQSILVGFSSINAVLFSFTALFSFRFNICTFIAMLIFSSTYLLNSFTKKNGYAGAIPFTAFFAIGLMRIVSPDTMGGYFLIITSISVLMLVFSLMGIIGEKLQNAFKTLTTILLIIAVAFGGVTSAFSRPVSLITLLAFALLAANTAYTILRHGKNYLITGFFSIQLMLLVNISVRLVSTNVCLTALMTCIGIFLISCIIKLLGEHLFRNTLSEALLLAGVIISTLVVYISSDGIEYHIFAIVALVLLTGLLLYTAFDSVTNEILAYFGRFSVFTALFMIIPKIQVILFRYFTRSNVYFISALFFMTLITVLGLVIFSKTNVSTTAAKWKLPVWVNVGFIGVLFMVLGSTNVYMIPFVFLCYSVFMLAGAYLNEFDTANVMYIVGMVLSVITSTMVGTCIINKIAVYNAVTYSDYIEILFPVVCSFVFCCIHLIKKNIRFEKVTLITGNILLSICLAILVSFDCDGSIIIFVVSTLLFALAVFMAYREKFTVHLTLPLLLISGFIIDFVYEISHNDSIPFDTRELIMFMSAIAIFIFMVAWGRIKHKRIFEKLNIDVFSIMAFPALLIGYNENIMETEIFNWVMLISLIAYCINFIGRAGKKTTIRVFLTITSAVGVIAWCTQPFFTLPDIIEREYYVAGILLFFLGLKFIWKNNPKAIDIMTFIAVVISLFVLALDAFSSRYLLDTIIILTGVLVMLLLSLKYKRKKWFILSISTTMVMTLAMSGDFWASILWWGYLMITGTLLIVVGVRAEINRRNALQNLSEGEELDKKSSGILSDWEW